MKKAVFRQRYSVLDDGVTKVFTEPVKPVEEVEEPKKEEKKEKEEVKKKNGRKFSI